MALIYTNLPLLEALPSCRLGARLMHRHTVIDGIRF
jgi:hypothetical protein